MEIYKDKRLGSGAFGVVFEGRFGAKRCAVKVLHHLATEFETSLPTAHCEQEEAKIAFDRECEFLKSFQHPNVVRHFSTLKHPSSNQTILAVELLECNLKHYLTGLGETVLTIEIEASISKDVASALAYLDSRNIVHRDLCGDNILLNASCLGKPPVAKVSDFGMSRVIDSSTLSSTLTALGHRMGYLPPEAPLIEASCYDSSLDIFSFGAIMTQIVRKLGTVKSPRDRNFNVSQIVNSHPLKPLIVACLDENKEDRPSASSVEHNLNEFLQGRQVIKSMYINL